MKKYNITYQHITGAIRVNSYNELFDFYLRLGELMEDEHVTNSSISFYTEEAPVKPLPKGERTLRDEQILRDLKLDEYERLREDEFKQFKAFKK